MWRWACHLGLDEAACRDDVKNGSGANSNRLDPAPRLPSLAALKTDSCAVDIDSTVFVPHFYRYLSFLFRFGLPGLSSAVCPVSGFVDVASLPAVVPSSHSLLGHCSSVFGFLCRASGTMSWSYESSPLRSASPARVLSVAMFSMVSILSSMFTAPIDPWFLSLSIVCGAVGACGLTSPVSFLCTSVPRCVAVGIVDVSSGFTGVACCN